MKFMEYNEFKDRDECVFDTEEVNETLESHTSQLNNIANELGRNEDGTEIDMGTIATTIRGAIKELKDNQGNNTGSGGLDLSSLTITTESADNGTKLILTDGTTTKEVTIPSATDTQVKTVIDALVADGTLSALTIEDGSISNVKLSAISQTRVNLVDTTASTPNKSINAFNYKPDSTTHDLTDFIPIDINRLYYLIGADTTKIQYSLYDESKVFVVGGNFNNIGTDSDGNKIANVTITNENAKYIRFGYLKTNTDKVMFNADKLRDYMHYNTLEKGLSLEGEELRNLLNENYKVTEKNINEKTITPVMTDFCFGDDLNLVDCANYMEVANSTMNYYYSNYFKVNNGETLYMNIPFPALYFYDKDKNLLSSVAGEMNTSGAHISKEVTVNQENVYYARIIYELSLYTNKSIMVTRYKGEQDEYKDFSTKWFTLDDKYKEYFIKNVLNVPTFSNSVKDIILPYVSPSAGKTLIAFGDSLMQYAGGNGTTQGGFFTQANKYLNMNMKNMGYAGSNWTGSGAGDCKARINNLVSDDISYDVILLSWGTNNDENLGTVDDEASDTGSMCAVMKWAVQQIRTNFPHSGLGIIIPPPSISGGNETKVNLMIECCKHESMHVPYLDLFHDANITVSPIGTGGLGDDQVHLGEHGRNRYASALKPFIEKLVPYINNYKITYNLTNVSANKTYKRLSEGTGITITLSASDGYTLDNSSVTVTIGGVDVTSDVYSNGTITVTVTNDIVITASATQNS